MLSKKRLGLKEKFDSISTCFEMLLLPTQQKSKGKGNKGKLFIIYIIRGQKFSIKISAEVRHIKIKIKKKKRREMGLM